MSKLIITAVAVLIVGGFAYFTTSYAVEIKHHLQEQNHKIQSLDTESKKLDKQLDTAKKVQEQTAEAVAKTEAEAAQKQSEREALEAQLGAN